MGLSIRAYARSKNLSDAGIRKHIARGTIAREPDGTLDPAKADAALAEIARRRSVPGRVAAARRRKLAARVADIADEVAALRAGAVLPADIDHAWRETVRAVGRILVAAGAAAAPKVAGREPGEVRRILDDAMHAALTRASEIDVEADEPAKPRRRRKPAELARLTEAALTERHLALQAERLEIRRALKRGKLELVEPFTADAADMLTSARGRAQAIPVRLALQMRRVDTAGAWALIEAEILDALSHLDARGVDVRALLGKAPAGRRKPQPDEVDDDADER